MTRAALAAPVMKRSAFISHDGLHRYNLVREWDTDRARVLFIMLNPSTADANVDDPTIRRCICFAKTWGFGSLEVVNLSSVRCTDPELLTASPGWSDGDARRTNAWEIVDAAERAALIIYAWGAHKVVKEHHLDWFLFSPFQMGRRVDRDYLYAKARVLATNKGGSPKHPLYVRGDAVPQEWS